MLFLFEHRDRGWTPDELRSGLSIDLDATASSSTIVNRRIELRLGDLIERGIVQQNPVTRTFTLAPADPAHFAFVERLFINEKDLDEARALIYLRPRGLDPEAGAGQSPENPSGSANS